MCLMFRGALGCGAVGFPLHASESRQPLSQAPLSGWRKDLPQREVNCYPALQHMGESIRLMQYTYTVFVFKTLRST